MWYYSHFAALRGGEGEGKKKPMQKNKPKNPTNDLVNIIKAAYSHKHWESQEDAIQPFTV